MGRISIRFARAAAVEAGRASALADSADAVSIDGEVLEVLGGYGLAHVRTPDGCTFGLNRQTPGLQFAALHQGQRVRVTVIRRFSRVLHAELLG